MDKFTTVQLEVSIEEVFPNPWNCNVQNDKTFEKEIESIKVHGFIVPVLVRKKGEIYEIIDGEHRWRACKALEFTKIKVESLGEIEDAMAKVLTIKLNNLRGQDDIIKRAKILKELNEGQLALLPFERKELEEEIKLLEFDFSQFEKKPEEVSVKGALVTEALTKALGLEKTLRKLHHETSDEKLKALFEQYFEWIKIIKEWLIFEK